MMDFFNKNYERYDAWYDENKFAYLSELEAVRRALPEKGYGLEIGVGSGRFAVPLGIDVGIDSSEEMVKLAGTRGANATLDFGDNLKFEDSTFDYIAIIFTLCFAENPKKVIEASRRVLKSGGKLIIGIVDKNTFLGQSYQRKDSIFYKHAHFFSVEEVRDMLKSYGFGDFTYLQTLFDYPENINAAEDPLEGYGEGGFVVISAIKKELKV